MANISTIKFLDELIIKAINAIPKSQKRPTKPISMIPLKYSMKTVTVILKYLEENELIYNKPTKNGNSFDISNRDRETASSPIDQKAVINFLNNSVSTPQGLEDNLSIVSNGIDTLDKFIDATLFNLTQKSTTEKNVTNSSKRKILKIRF